MDDRAGGFQALADLEEAPGPEASSRGPFGHLQKFGSSSPRASCLVTSKVLTVAGLHGSDAFIQTPSEGGGGSCTLRDNLALGLI